VEGYLNHKSGSGPIPSIEEIRNAID
jgi:hypothetical protein